MVIVNLRLSSVLGQYIVDMYRLEFYICRLSLEIHFGQKKHVLHLYDDKDDNSCKFYAYPLFKPKVLIMELILLLLQSQSLLTFLKPH